LIAFPLRRARRRARTALLPLCTGLWLTWALACAAPEAPPDADWPAGALLAADGEALRSLLRELESLHDTPTARAARRLREALPACEAVEAVAERAGDWSEVLRCADPTGPLSGLHAWRGGAAAALALPLAAEGPRTLLRLHRDTRGVRLDLRWTPPSEELAALLPGNRPPGPQLLDARERLLHARVRVDGALDLAALVPEGSQADQLLHLRAEALGAAVLDGTWEAALYTPLPGTEMPRVALALGVRSRTVARAAAERLVAEVARNWSVAPTPLATERYTGACLLDLRVLPELAPCYASTERALVFAWNPASLRRALAGDAPATGGSATTDGAAGHLTLDLAALRRVDRQLARGVGPGAMASVADWPWSRLVASGERSGGDGALALRIALETAVAGPRP
jgi:hypothetical protein